MRTDGVAIAGRGDRRRAPADRRASSADATCRTSRASTAARPRTRRKRTRRSARPTSRASPPMWPRHLDRDQRRLYELIWKRTVASQMASALLDQVAVDIADAAGRLRLRATGSVIVFDGFLTLYQEDRDDTGDEDEEGGRLPAMRRGERARPRRGDARAAFHPAAAALHRGEPGQEARRARHRPALDLCLDHRRCCRTATMSGSTSGASFPRTAAASSPPSSTNFFERYVEYNFTADLENQLDDISGGRIDWKEVLRNFWRDFSAAVDGTKESDDQPGADGARRGARAAFLPRWRSAARTRASARSAAPAGSASSSASSAPSSAAPTTRTAASRGRSRIERRRRRQPPPSRHRARHRPGERPAGHAEKGSLRPLRPARRQPTASKPKRVALPKGIDAGRGRSRDGAAAAGAAARDRPPSRDGRADHRRHRPLRRLPQARHRPSSRSPPTTTC